MNAGTAQASALAQAACDALCAAAANADESIVALDTLATILGNAMSAPRGSAGDKFRSIRPGRVVIENKHSAEVESPPPPPYPLVCISVGLLRASTCPRLNLLLLLRILCVSA